MDTGFLSYALLIEIIVVLVIWIAFLHWRLKKRKNQLAEVPEPEEVNEFEIYLQYLNRELAETRGHLDELAEAQSDDIETINMYQYRLRHLEAEQKAMQESAGDIPKFWEIYRSNIDFVYVEDESQDAEAEPVAEPEKAEPEPEPAQQRGELLQGELDAFKKNTGSLLQQSEDVIDLVTTLVAKSSSEELQHMLGLLEAENEQLKSRLAIMDREYERMLQNLAVEQGKSPVSQIARDTGDVSMANVAKKQNERIKELNDIVGSLALELDQKQSLLDETEWVTRQVMEMEHVIVILEDENSFLRGQIKELVK